MVQLDFLGQCTHPRPFEGLLRQQGFAALGLFEVFENDAGLGKAAVLGLKAGDLATGTDGQKRFILVGVNDVHLEVEPFFQHRQLDHIEVIADVEAM